MELLTIITIIFGVAMSVGYFTQTYKIFKKKSAKDVSLLTYLFFGSGIIIWLLYGISIQSYPVIISNIVYLVGVISVLLAYFSVKR
ncbi:hypothetical protein HOG16_03565 [Candidatus Woesearchaeota archaeon]|jgi:MtN3 and saliva related transmembrane protein|nr:hypothetical protein [Candidatus Woesearchaeota archaeon]MBT4321603.1 hypothetical protein [Candidatus Woesearchaeota archaeon]MBT4631086.1 hypothetical protein [Candidatus Woesearchaeota archaeon]